MCFLYVQGKINTNNIKQLASPSEIPETFLLKNWNKTGACARIKRSKKNLGRMSIKGRIANFYHCKSKVVNALWILAQVVAFLGCWPADRFCYSNHHPSHFSVCLSIHNGYGYCHEVLQCGGHCILFIHVVVQDDAGKAGKLQGNPLTNRFARRSCMRVFTSVFVSWIAWISSSSLFYSDRNLTLSRLLRARRLPLHSSAVLRHAPFLSFSST